MLSTEDPDQAIQSVMRTLIASAITTNLGRCVVLDRALSALERGDATVELLAEGEHAAHQVVGSAGTFGFPHVSELATRLQAYLTDVAAPESAGDSAAADLAQARGWLTQIQEELQRGSAGGHQPER